MHDLVLRGGTVIDPSQGLNARADVAVAAGRMVEVGATVGPGARILDVSGRIVTPGLIDLHAHVFDGISSNGVAPDLAGVRTGVTTIADAGCAESATFEAFPRDVLPKYQTEVLPFLHICQTGLATNPDIIAGASIDLDATLNVLSRDKGLIRGIKARMVSPALEILGMDRHAAFGQTRCPRGPPAAHGPHWRYDQTLSGRCRSRAAPAAGAWRHRHTSVHGQPARTRGAGSPILRRALRSSADMPLLSARRRQLRGLGNGPPDLVPAAGMHRDAPFVTASHVCVEMFSRLIPFTFLRFICTSPFFLRRGPSNLYSPAARDCTVTNGTSAMTAQASTAHPLVVDSEAPRPRLFDQPVLQSSHAQSGRASESPQSATTRVKTEYLATETSAVPRRVGSLS